MLPNPQNGLPPRRTNILIWIVVPTIALVVVIALLVTKKGENPVGCGVPGFISVTSDKIFFSKVMAVDPKQTYVPLLNIHQIYSLKVGDSQPTHLIDVNTYDHFGVSPDGQYLVVSNYSDNQTDPNIYTVDLNDGKFRKRFFHAGQTPSWSPDGQHIAFLKKPQSGGLELVMLNADGLNLRSLAHDQNYIGPVSWSADGSKILVSIGLQLTSIDLINDGGGQMQLFKGSAVLLGSWSPTDNERVAFRTSSQLLTGTTDKPDTHSIVPATFVVYDFTWLKDGQSIVFLGTDVQDKDQYGLYQVEVGNKVYQPTKLLSLCSLST